MLKISLLFSKERFSAHGTHKARSLLDPEGPWDLPETQLLVAFSKLLGALFSKSKPCGYPKLSLVLFAVVSRSFAKPAPLLWT